jgi:ABC-type Fe3+ transport system permease subunit/DNA-binding beta-propeller fold protein YncE
MMTIPRPLIMFSSRGLLQMLVLLLWLGAVAWPLVCAAASLIGCDPSAFVSNRTGAVLTTSLGWAAGIALLACVIGWWPGRVLAAVRHRRGGRRLVILTMLPICLPAYVVFYAWWQAWPADSMIFRWAIRHDLFTAFRNITLALGLVCWSWPIVSWCVAAMMTDEAKSVQDLLALDGAPAWKRLLVHARYDRLGLLLGAGIVFVLTFGNTTCFDLANIFTFGNELRAMLAQGASHEAILIASWPALAVLVLGLLVIVRAVSRHRITITSPPLKAFPVARALTHGTWIVTFAVPVALMVLNLLQSGRAAANLARFMHLYRDSVTDTLFIALCVSLAGLFLVVGMASLWDRHSKVLRHGADAMLFGWLIVAIVPDTVVSAAFEAAYNRPVLDDLIYTTPAVLILAQLARFGIIPVLIGRLIVLREPAPLRELRQLDQAHSLRDWVISTRPRLLAACAASTLLLLIFSIGEIPITAQLQPVSIQPLATAVLNAMHYQQPDTVLIATLGMVVIAVLVAVAVAFVMIFTPRTMRHARITGIVLALCTVLVVPGCDRAPADEPRPLDVDLTFGRAGYSLGQFSLPRGIAVDGERKYIYIVDKSARVQRFGFDGEPHLQWQMPEYQLGKPTGLNVAPDGRVFIADTHYFRVMVYDEQGRELMRFGEYGTEDGQFIFPTDVVFLPDGRLVVSEYGGNDRIQIFDAQGRFLQSFGGPGRETGQFNRPQSMVLNDDASELFIADACNHRIAVYDLEGTLLRYIGEAGTGPGQLAYPYDLTFLDDGSLLVIEHGNHRLQKFDPRTGRCIGLFGGYGLKLGKLKYPWGVDACAGKIFVLDSGNYRAHILDQP